MTLWIGTSGWHYQHWRGRLYPPGLPPKSWLAHYSGRFAAVESNSAFYRLPAPATFTSWTTQVPRDFRMAVKASRFLTHVRRLEHPQEPVDRLLEHARYLGVHLGPVLLQLPPTLEADCGLLDATLTAFGGRVAVAVETRHPSWNTPKVHALLRAHGAAWCLADSPARPSVIASTAPWTYLRFHQGRGRPAPCYEIEQLRAWVQVLADTWGPTADIWVFFNNDPLGCAVRDAVILAELAGAAGLQPTRVPPRDEAPVG